MLTRVIRYKKLKNETETVMSLEDVLNIVRENLGSEVECALIDYLSEEKKEGLISADTFIEGIFQEQIQESDLLEKLVNKILEDLNEQGFLKKNKNIDKFIPSEAELIEMIDSELSLGIKNYFSYWGDSMQDKVALVKFLRGSFEQEYSYFTDIEDLKKGDIVLVQVNNSYGLAEFSRYSYSKIDIKKSEKWIVKNLTLDIENFEFIH